jgi:hypothetical protein
MEDGVFLGRVISKVLRGSITTREATDLCEKKRIPRVWVKQQASFVNGQLSTLYGFEQQHRNSASAPEVTIYDRNPGHPGVLPPTYRRWQLFSRPETVPGILSYDIESDADFAVCEYMHSKGDVDPKTLVSKSLRDKWWKAIYGDGIYQSVL